MRDDPARLTILDAGRAQAIAQREIGTGPAAGDPVFASWRGATAGAPVQVYDQSGRPSYWLVAVHRDGAVVGFVRVLGDGRVGASIAQGAGTAITAIDPSDARGRAMATIDLAAGERCGDVLLVHDGPPGREAWRVEVRRAGRPVRWVFVTPGGTYSRSVGELRDESRE